MSEKSPKGSGARRKPITQRAFYWLAWSVVQFAITVLYRFRRFNLERVPTSGPVLLVANHQSHLDPPLVAFCVRRRQYRPLARESLFKAKLFGGAIRALNAVPLRENEGDLGAIRTAIDLLRDGEPVCIFPEGSRTHDGAMHEFKRGVTVLLRRADCMIVPLAIEGAYDAFPRHRKFPRLFGAHVAIMAGEPIDSKVLMRDGPDEALRRLEREIDAMRLTLRSRLRAASHGRCPRPGPGDHPSFDVERPRPLGLAS